MANGIIKLNSDATGFEGQIVWSSLLDATNKRSTLTLQYQIRRTAGGANASNYSVSATVDGVIAAGVGPTYHNYNTTGNIAIGDTTNWKTLTSSTHTIYHSDYNGKASVAITCTIAGGVNKVNWTVVEAEIALDRIFKKATFTSTPNFTDESNPTIGYDRGYVDSLQAGITTDANSYAVIVPFRDINIYGSSYTFNLTTAERNALIAAAGTKTSTLVRFYLRMVIDGTTYETYQVKSLTIVNAGSPTITATIEDVSSYKSLTGGGLKFIRGYNSMQFSMTATGQKGATIESVAVICGSQTIRSTSGTFTNIENEVVIFSATDSRGKTATKTIVLEPINYIELTCNQTVRMILQSDTEAQISLDIEGNFFDEGFGKLDNYLILYVRHKRNDEDYGEWVDITPLITDFGNGRYTLHADMSGFDPSGTYTFQCAAEDFLNTVVTEEYPVQFIPVFDWGKADFNFNVPVTIEGNPLNDYVVEYGQEPMGSNGTWYWSKWKSGKAECYGCRNYGNMAVSTDWGGWFRSEDFSQDLPSGLFADTPEVIDINLRQGSSGGWVVRYEYEEPADYTTGSFIIVRPKSATISQAYISFNVIGRWK